jgi:pSer/pThr/pTyr-binding forkhead associated (FHA) protein
VTMTLGREHDNNIELKDKDVSRYHARIIFSSGEYHIQDLDSSSGTFVNGDSITEKQLSHGDKINVGSTELLIDFD